MRTIESDDEVRRLLEKRPHRTRTYRVSAELLRGVRLDSDRELRELSDTEVQEVADFLEVDRGELQGPFKVVDATCPSCERRLGFLDFVRTAVQTEAHDRDRLREVLTGRAGYWLTIRGLDGGRPVLCVACGQVARLPTGYSEYSSSSYAYA
jgi:hypothetical protein